MTPLQPATVRALTDSLAVDLSCRLRRPDHSVEPPGAVDYYATFSLTWDPDDEEIDPGDIPTLAALAEKQPGSDELPESVSLPVGGAHLLVCDLDNSELLDALDSREGDLEYIASTILDLRHGGLLPELADALSTFESYAIIINSAHIDPQWRGGRLGLLGTGLALRELSRGCALAALDPMEPGTVGEQARAASHARLSRYWGNLGFKPFVDRVNVLDLGTVAFGEAMEQLMPTGELGEAHRSHSTSVDAWPDQLAGEYELRRPQRSGRSPRPTTAPLTWSPDVRRSAAHHQTREGRNVPAAALSTASTGCAKRKSR